MVLVSASLFSPKGTVLPPLPSLFLPIMLSDPPILEESILVDQVSVLRIVLMSVCSRSYINMSKSDLSVRSDISLC